MVILSQVLSFTSRPDSGAASNLATRYMGVVRVNLTKSLSDSGMEEVREGEELEVMVLRVGLPVNGRIPYSPRCALVCITHALGSKGRIGSAIIIITTGPLMEVLTSWFEHCFVRLRFKAFGNRQCDWPIRGSHDYTREVT